MVFKLAERGIVSGSYDACEMPEVAAMLGSNEPRDDDDEVVGNPMEDFLVPGWRPPGT